MFSRAEGPSSLFTKYFKNGTVKYLGRTIRRTKLDNKVTENVSFRKFMDLEHLPEPTSHRMVLKNMIAGFISCAKYDRPQPIGFCRQSWELACSWVRSHFGPWVRGSQVLTQDEAITELEKSTSTGFPWNLVYFNKREFLAVPENLDILTIYWDHITNTPVQWGVIIDGEYHPIWTCSEKVEMRSVEKLMKNSIRTFTAAPIEHTVAATRLCLDFNNKFYSTRDTWSFVGQSKFFCGWDRLEQRMSKHVEGLEFDASSWDASVFDEALLDQMNFRYECLEIEEQTPTNLRRLENIYNEVINSVIVMENGELIMKSTGMPSGFANTIVDNTMILFRVIAYAWIRSCPYPATYLDFMEKVEGALNGDDNNLAISRESRTHFNAETISMYVAELGIKFETPNKEFRPVEQLTFLSQEAIKYGSLWLPAPDTEKVLCSLWWGSDTDDIRWHLLRAAALYVDSWANVKCRKIIGKYIDFVCTRYRRELRGTVNGIPTQEIFHNIKSDAWCYQLYTGQEGKVGPIKHNPFKFEILMDSKQLLGFDDNEIKEMIGKYYQGITQEREVELTDYFAHLLGVESSHGLLYDPAYVDNLGYPTTPEDLVDDLPFEYAKPIAPGTLGTPIKVSVQQGKRRRTGSPFVDELVGVEENPGPHKGNKPIKKLEHKLKREAKTIRKAARSTSNHAGPRRGTNSGNGNMMPQRGKTITNTALPVAIGSSIRNNNYSIGKVDNCIADCVRTNGINVKGTCFSNLGVGIVTGPAGDRSGLFLDGLVHANNFIAFNFQDFDDRVAALATTHQYYRVRKLTAEYVPLVGTTTVGQWAFAINDNYNPSSGTSPLTINSLLTAATSGAGTPWVPRTLPTYTYDGAKVWSCPSASEDGSNANAYEQLVFIGRYLNTVSALDDVETGRMQLHYSIDFFEPRGNRGVITAENVNFDDLQLFLGPSIMRSMRHDKSAWREPFIKALRNFANELEVKGKKRTGKDEEYILSSEPLTPEVEENPLTKSLHLPQSTVQALLTKLGKN